MLARHVTALILGEPTLDCAANWMEIGPQDAGGTVVSEGFARRRFPAPVVAALRSKPCFYICVDDVRTALAHVPGQQVGKPVRAHGMREVCVETDTGMIVLAERA